jgi:hypothetical protein
MIITKTINGKKYQNGLDTFSKSKETAKRTAKIRRKRNPKQSIRVLKVKGGYDIFFETN